MQRHTTPLTPARRGGPSGWSQAQSHSQLSQVWKYLPEAPGPPLSPHPEGQELQVTRRQRLAALRPCPLPSSHRPPGRASRPRHRPQRSPVQGRCPSSAGRPVATRHPRQPPGLAHLGGLPGLASEATRAPAVQRAGEEGTGGWGGGRRRGRQALSGLWLRSRVPTWEGVGARGPLCSVKSAFII